MKKEFSIKFPSGNIGHELLHYMGADDEQTLKQRPDIAQQLVNKCFTGKVCQLNSEELEQLVKETENALDIKSDHVGRGEWNHLQQYNLAKFLQKIQDLLL